MLFVIRHLSNALVKKSNFPNRSCINKQLLFTTVTSSINPTEAMAPTIKYDYPNAPKDKSCVDDFYGVKVTDIYRGLEDPDSESTLAYIDAQNEISQPFLEVCSERKKIKEKLTKLWNYPRYGCPSRYGNKYYFHKNDGLQNQNVVYKKDTLDGEPKVFLDPNTLSEDGTVSLSTTTFSEDGKLCAYGLSESGSDWIKIKIKNTETGKDYEEVLEKIKFSSFAWTHDNKGFFYGRYADQDGKVDGSETKSNENQKLYYHRVGEPQSKDILVVEFPEEPTWRIGAEVTHCGKYLILSIVKDCRDNILFFTNLEKVGEIKGKLDIRQFVYKFESDYDYISNTGSKVVFRTNKNAPNYHLVVIDFDNPEPENWTTLVKEHENDVLDWATCNADNKLIICFIREVKTVLQVHSLETGEFIRSFPLDIGTISSISGKKHHTEIFYTFVSFLNPGTIYRFDFADGIDSEPTIYREIKLNLDGFNKDDYKVEQVFYPSKDGEKIPMFIVRKKKDEIVPRPCLLYGYGGFNISLLPTFSVTSLMFIDTFDGVLAFPNLRGGGEYGERWHNAGRLLNKQNVFNDFQCSAKYLIENKYTTNKKLIIQGGSNGGLLVGACINQAPNLFGAAISQVGVLDMLRYHKFTIGHAWCSDYGNPCEKKEYFDNLMTYSPLHNVNEPKNENEEYPSTLILTADHDDRVSPLHSLKFAAALQDAIRNSQYQKNPVFLRVYNKSGHGAGKPTTKKIEEATDILTFIYKSLDEDKINI